MPEEVRVQLGEIDVPVYPQKHAYITNKLGKLFAGLVEDGTDINDASDLASVLGGNAYEVLAAMLPTWGSKVEKHEFMGYSSPELWQEGGDPDALGKVPDFPQMIDAFEKITLVNRLDVLKTLWKAVGLDPTMLRKWLNAKVAERLSSTMQPISHASEVGSGASTSSGTTAPTAQENEGSQSPDSLISQPPTGVAEQLT